MLGIILLSVSVLCIHFNPTYGADGEPVINKKKRVPLKITPFVYDVHGKDALKVAQKNFKLMCPPSEEADPEEQKKEFNRLTEKLDCCLYNHYIMSLTKCVKNSLERVVLIRQAQVKGLMDFYIRAEDEKGYIETLCTNPPNKLAYQKRLIKYALRALQKKEVAHTLTHVLATDKTGQKPLRALGFKKQKQGALEKEASAFAFEYTYENTPSVKEITRTRNADKKVVKKRSE